MKIGKYDVTPDNIRSFITGTTYKVMEDMGHNRPEYQKKQMILRSILCKECLDNKECTVCFCKTPDLFYDPLRVDKKGRWEEMLSEEEYLSFDRAVSSINDINEIANLYSKYYRKRKANSHSNMTRLFDEDICTYNVGIVDHMTRLRHLFRIPIINPFPVKIISAIPDCSCTSIIASMNKTLLPGELFEVELSYQAKNKGSFSRSVNVKGIRESDSTEVNGAVTIKGVVK